MPETQIKELLSFSLNHLKKIQQDIENFLNNYSLEDMLNSTEEKNNEEIRTKTKYLLTDMRHLLVGCEDIIKKMGVITRSNSFNKDLAEHVLYETVHYCVNKFYYPDNEVYEEDGRNSYTGKDAIKFAFEPHPTIKELILSLSKYFEVLREELEYYETDYITKKRFEGRYL